MSGECIDPHDVLGEYDLGTVNEVAGAGGTAGKTWKVRASSGDYLLRLRGVRTSAVSRLRYDHGLRDHLVVRGIPTASAVRTRKGATWVTRSGRVLDLYVLVVGRSFHPESNKEMANAAYALAEFHEAAATYQPELIPEQIDQYLKPAVRGERLDCLAMTEPGAGSDLKAMTTRAVKDGDDYVINGLKHFVSFGVRADYVILFAVTGTTDTPRGPQKEISAFLVDKGTPGFEWREGPVSTSHPGMS